MRAAFDYRGRNIDRNRLSGEIIQTRSSLANLAANSPDALTVRPIAGESTWPRRTVGIMARNYGTTSALIVVDMQNDFADPAGSLFVAGGNNITPAINGEIAAVESAGGHVFYTQDWHPSETPHFADFGGVWPIHCVRDTWGAEFVTDLDVRGPVVRKGVNGEDGYSGFTMRDPKTNVEKPTELQALLVEQGVSHVTVVGLALDVCVKATALDAVANGYETVVLEAQSAPVNLQPRDGAAAIDQMRAASIAVR